MRAPEVADDPRSAGPAPNGDRGHLGFRVGTIGTALTVLAAAAGRMALEAASIGHVARGWVPTLASLLAVALVLRVVPPSRRWAARTADGLAIAVLALCLLFTFEYVTGMNIPGLDGAPALWRSTLAELPFHGRPAPMSLVTSVLAAVAVWTVGHDSRWAVRTSATTTLLSGSYALVLLFALAQPDTFQVAEFFSTTPGAVASSALMLLGLTVSLILCRPHRPPLGPLLTTRMWPLAAFGTLLLTTAVLVSQVAYRLTFDSGGSATTAARWAFVVQVTAVIALLWFTVWYASHQQRRAALAAQARATADALSRVSYHSAVAMVAIDSDGLVRSANPAYERLLGHRLDDIRGRRWPILASAPDGQTPTWWTTALTDDVVHTERVLFTHEAGQPVWVDITCSAAGQAEDHREVMLAQLIDVTAIKAAQDEQEYRASHDDLTGLLRRAAVAQEVDRLVGLGSGSVLVVLVGLDNFRQINEAYGHTVGDELLVCVARTLTRTVPARAVLGRLGGDEFAVVLTMPGAPNDGTIRRLIDRLLAVVEQDFDLSGLIVRTSASLGVVTLQEGSGLTGHEALRSAASALAQAKRDGGHRWQSFDSVFHAQVQERAELLESLRASLQVPGEIQAWFQPIVDLRTMDTVGYEALARWVHPERGVVPAGSWIEAAETDLRIIHQLGLVTAHEAAAFASQLPEGQHVTLNVSGSHLSSREFPEFADLLRELHRRHPNRLIIELTETTLANIRGPGRARLDQLVASGIGLWADDFGTGYSSVAHLRDLPLTGLKLDKSFTSGLSDPASSVDRITEGLAGLSAGLGLTTVAEGIETRKQAQRVSTLGWELGQGWLFGRPNPPDFYLNRASAAATPERTAERRPR